MTRLVVCAIVAVVVASYVGANVTMAQEPEGRRVVFNAFEQRVAAYAELSRRIDAGFPPLAPSDDLQMLAWRRASVAAAITAERRHAQQGDIFDTRVAPAVRDVITNALIGVDLELMLADLFEDCNVPADYRPQVNGTYLDSASHAMPPRLLAALPRLPEGIQYRLINRDLLLWDVNADVIIDVLPDALPFIESSEE
jgi:hypothetical protein